MNPTEWLAIVLVATAAISLGDKRLRPVILTYGVQAGLLGALVLFEGYDAGRWSLMAYGAAILVVKAVLTPWYLSWASRRIGMERELEPLLNIPMSLVAAGLCLMASLRVADELQLETTDERVLIVAGLATVLLGLLTMATRRQAITQALGLLTMENGAFLFSLTLAEGLPLAIELAVFLEVIVLVVLLGILFHRIRESFDSLDASAMTTLGE